MTDSKTLRKCLERAHLDSQAFTAHSFRIGAATHAASSGASDAQLLGVDMGVDKTVTARASKRKEDGTANKADLEIERAKNRELKERHADVPVGQNRGISCKALPEEKEGGSKMDLLEAGEKLGLSGEELRRFVEAHERELGKKEEEKKTRPVRNRAQFGTASGIATCYTCGDPSHFARDCPVSKDARPTGASSFFTSTGEKAGQQATFIVAGQVEGKKVPLLLDTGSTQTLIRGDLVDAGKVAEDQGGITCVHGKVRRVLFSREVLSQLEDHGYLWISAARTNEAIAVRDLLPPERERQHEVAMFTPVEPFASPRLFCVLTAIRKNVEVAADARCRHRRRSGRRHRRCRRSGHHTADGQGADTAEGPDVGVGDIVAVAYDNGWYSGAVKEVRGSDLKMKFKARPNDPTYRPKHLLRGRYFGMTAEDMAALMTAVEYKLSGEMVQRQRSLRSNNKCEATHLALLKSLPKSKTWKRNAAGRAANTAHSVAEDEVEAPLRRLMRICQDPQIHLHPTRLQTAEAANRVLFKAVKSFFLANASAPGVGQTIRKMAMTKEEKQFAEEAERETAAFHGHQRRASIRPSGTPGAPTSRTAPTLLRICNGNRHVTETDM
ncbi:hypothetical protein Bbelb_185780 [Branchiostoma belcheri]|nr:hypothetical protein Bbelb_185780 [Branchiostoma belcheri]